MLPTREKKGEGERGKGKGEWGMGNGEWGMGNGEWGKGKGERGKVKGNRFLLLPTLLFCRTVTGMTVFQRLTKHTTYRAIFVNSPDGFSE